MIAGIAVAHGPAALTHVERLGEHLVKVFDELDAPVQRVCSLDSPAIYSPPLEKIQLPYPEVIVAKALSIC